jgi:hypothetical protein
MTDVRVKSVHQNLSNEPRLHICLSVSLSVYDCNHFYYQGLVQKTHMLFSSKELMSLLL